MPYPVVLGLDWLTCHNLTINRVSRELFLSCCGANPTYPIPAVEKGFGLPSTPMHMSSTAFVGLGPGLHQHPFNP